MNSVQLNKTLRLIKRTGDKAVVLDQDSDQVFVLMNIDDYEDILDYCNDEVVVPPVKPTLSADSEDEFEDYVLDDTLETAEKAKQESSAQVIPEETVPSESKETAPETIALATLAPAVVAPIVVPEPQILPVQPNPAVGEQESRVISEESLTDVPHEEETFFLEPVE